MMLPGDLHTHESSEYYLTHYFSRSHSITDQALESHQVIVSHMLATDLVETLGEGWRYVLRPQAQKLGVYELELHHAKLLNKLLVLRLYVNVEKLTLKIWRACYYGMRFPTLELSETALFMPEFLSLSEVSANIETHFFPSVP
jgi:hypothetical protein